MRLTHLTLRNWRNFKEADFPVEDRLVVLGPNASGKSNLLDALRFLRQVASAGGGFQEAVQSRGGLPRVRCLAARNFNHGHVTIGVRLGDNDREDRWSYELTFTRESRGLHRPILSGELVKRDGEVVLDRPDPQDRDDSERLTQTYLEQVNANQEFRPIADFLRTIRYLHLVPHLLREPGRQLDRSDDPYGSDFLLRIARTPARTRDQRLRRIGNGLKAAVPQLSQLELVQDDAGRPHLEARYGHWRPKGAKQNEHDFSDGTLRLVGLLWSLLEGRRDTGPVLLEEPELSLHPSVVRQLPSILSRFRGTGGPQVLLTTHSEEILKDQGLGLDEVVVLEPGTEGTTALLGTSVESASRLLENGLSLAEILGPRTRPKRVDQLSGQLFLQ
ncbi:MAG: AAA family ATPase [Holophagales bacterium]|nr:AAA family ATPase [Holophagales bacterium]MYC09454.1 AAA family ATPase [Holophagales bacterium]